MKRQKNQKIVNEKLENIQTSLNDLRQSVDNLEFSLEIKHFDNHIKFPTRHIFHAVQRFLEHPTNSTKDGLIMKCHIHTPNSILNTLNDILNEDWLLDQVKHYEYKSPAVNKLIKKLDRIVEILAISQAACSGMHEMEDAEYDFKKLSQAIKQIWDQVQRTKDIVHKTYFKYSKTVLQKFVEQNHLHMGTEENPISKVVLDYLQTNYNYGPLYTIMANDHKTIQFVKNSEAEFLAYSFVGNFPSSNFSCTINVIQASSLCEYSDKVAMKIMLDKVLANNYPVNCSSDFVCFLGRMYMFTTNGGICAYGGDTFNLNAIITKPFPQNFTYKSYAPRTFHRYGSRIIFEPVVYVEEKLFMEQNFKNLLLNSSLQDEEIITLRSTLLPLIYQNNADVQNVTAEMPSELLTSLGQGDEGKYSNFKALQNYVFSGKIKCKNGNSVGKDCTVKLIEVDTMSMDDTVDKSKNNNGWFSLHVSSTYNDAPSGALELKLEFEDCCGYFWDRENGFLINGTNVEYIV